MQIDAAINPGNSGGPAFSDIQRGLVVGVAFSKLRTGDNIGFIIPTPVVRHFLDEVAAYGGFRGVAGRGFQWQKAENAALRCRHRIPAGASGVLVARLDPLAPSSAPRALQPRDILQSVGGVAIADDGTVAFRGAERLDFTHLWRQRHVGEELCATVWRDGASRDVTFAVQRPHPLVPILHTVDATPSYYIVGGLVFLPLSVPFLEHGYGASWRKVTPVKLQALLAEYRTHPDEEVVLLFQILSAELNYGYKGTSLWVTHFNGQKVRNLAQMAALVESASGEFLEWDTDDGSCIVLDRAEAMAQGGTILAQHAIANDRSADLRPDPKQPAPQQQQPMVARSALTTASRRSASLALPRRRLRLLLRRWAPTRWFPMPRWVSAWPLPARSLRPLRRMRATCHLPMPRRCAASALATRSVTSASRGLLLRRRPSLLRRSALTWRRCPTAGPARSRRASAARLR